MATFVSYSFSSREVVAWVVHFSAAFKSSLSQVRLEFFVNPSYDVRFPFLSLHDISKIHADILLQEVKSLQSPRLFF